MNNIMVDCESFGTAPGCAIRSIGAVEFDPISGEIGGEFYANVDDDSCLAVGLVQEPQTVEWWAKQSATAQASLLTNQIPLQQALTDFVAWFRSSRGIFVWSQGSNFDEPVLTAAMRAVNIKPPWKYYDVRDTRTCYEMARLDTRTIKRNNGNHHDALDDARYQVRCVQAAYAKLYNGRGA